MIKKNLVWIFFAFSILFFLIKFLPLNLFKTKDTAYFETVEIGGGWGYNIYKNDSIYIHQMTIPAIQGIKNFRTEGDAKKVASLVLKKMKQNQLPVIKVEDLDNLQIQ